MDVTSITREMKKKCFMNSVFAYFFGGKNLKLNLKEIYIYIVYLQKGSRAKSEMNFLIKVQFTY